ncbi:MAG: SBBP repeat-containing protein, partial [Bacteroidetes bacterium]|nr:SBBP repeat-containing protein [Bacteroidota bacterium]
AGNIFITGDTYSTNMPQKHLAGAYNQLVNSGGYDAFVIKFDIVKSELLWATYYGGSGDEWGASIGTDIAGNIFITGQTTSANFPLQASGTAYYQSIIKVTGSNFDAFVVKFNNLNSLVWSTFYGGGNFDCGNSVVTDFFGNIYLTGQTNSSDFPIFSSTGAYNQSVWGGSNDSYVVKFSNSGLLLWSSYLGGKGTEFGATAIADASGNIFINGRISGFSTGFPLLNPFAGSYFQGSLSGSLSDYFIVKFNPLGVILWSTFFGGTSDEEQSNSFDNCSIDSCGNIFVAFITKSSDLPLIKGCDEFHDGTYGGGNSWGDCFVTKFSNTGILLWNTYLGGGSDEFNISIANDNNGALFLTLRTFSNGGMPILNKAAAYNDNTFNGISDLFITKFSHTNTYSQSQVNSDCSCSGSATVTLNCHYQDFNYVWSTGSQTLNTPNKTNTITGLCMGTYTVTVTSNCNQSLTAIYNIIGGGGTISLSSTIINPTCTTSGMASITANGGTAPYSYLWSTGNSTQTVTGLSAGQFTVTVTDKNSCTAIATIVIISPVKLVVQFDKGTANCAGCGCKEWIMINAVGGTSPYSYLWSDGSVNRYKNKLCSGTHKVNIKDKNGCSVDVNLTAP